MASSVVFSPDVNMPRMHKAAEILAQRFAVSKEQVLSTMTEHLLIYFAEFKADSKSVTFSLLSGSTPKADEIRLNAQDGFVISGWGRGVRRVTKSTDGEYSSNEPIMWSNQPQYFNGLAGGVTEYKSLFPFFSGKLSLSELNGEPIINEYSGLLTLNEPLGNYSPATSAPLNEEYPEFSIDRVTRLIYPQQTLLGSVSYEAVVKFGNGVYSQCEGKKDSAGADRTTQNVAVFALKGWKVPGLAASKLLADR
jgi:hypothetical protein